MTYRFFALVPAALLIVAGCTTPQPAPETPLAATTSPPLTTSTLVTSTILPSSPDKPDVVVVSGRPDWLGQRPLPTTPDGKVTPQTTPEELLDRRLPTVDTLPPPPADDGFVGTSSPLTDEVLARSTWVEGCPVEPNDLAYLTMSFWGFDDRPHTGEMIVHGTVADDILAVFSKLFEARFPIEEMRIVTKADLDALPTGDGNNTSSFVCRQVTGGSRFSEHAYGLAIDINPFHNPYQRGQLILPELATSYLERSPAKPGLVLEGDVVHEAFRSIGWGWGGNWDSLKDYQHFSKNNR